MRKSERTPHGRLVGLWPLLFPATYLIHIAEEFWAGDGFYNWIARIGGAGFTAERFLEINALAWTVMFALCVLVVARSGMLWVSIAFATVVLLNGMSHVIMSVVTTTYSPGTISGVLLWIPLGVVTLTRSYPLTSHQYFAAAAALGLLAHVFVLLIAFRGS
jgi:hypothetical protein